MSQEYTPVEWVDETPTQIGTVINKARLDQMQSAHHYADGFEEVDTAPTADPGVDYHKVVYCTADNSFYRWDGTAWTKDVDDDTKALLLAHEADHANPHVVTKSQIGLGNVDNTSDIAKPISNATQAALAEKIGTDKIVGSWSNDPDNAHIPGEKLAKDSIDAVATDVSAIEGKIPAQASPSNQLADKDFVNSSIATNTANFLGTYDAESDLGFASATVDTWTDPPSSSVESDVGSAISTKLSALGKTATNNDYVFVSVDQSTTTDPDWYWRFKFNGSAWVYEFTLNNSSFTADQWAAINSGITAGLVSSYSAHVASTSNPHSVTKSQVGLGNVDNTSDMNKPVSTAQATAIGAKVDKLTTKPTAGTYTKVTINSEGQVTAGSTLAATDIPSLDWSKITSGKPTTLAGYGITDAVDIGSVQTITGLKTFKPSGGASSIIMLQRDGSDSSSAITNATVEFKTNGGSRGRINNWEDGTGVYTQLVAIGNSTHYIQVSANKSDNTAWAIAPARAYNANNTSDIVTIGLMTANAVTIADNQTITGHKTIQNATLTVQSTNYPNMFLKDTDSYIGDNTGAELGALVGRDKNDKRLAECRFYKGHDSVEWSQARLVAYDPNNLTDNASLAIFNRGSSNKYSTTAYRAYNSSNVSDIVTIGSLASNPNVVHTTGNETIYGEKTFSNAMRIRNVRHAVYVDEGTGYSQTVLTSVSPDGNTEIRLFLASRDDGTTKLEIGKWRNGAYVTSTVVATL